MSNFNSKFRPSMTRKPKLEDEINRFNRGFDTMTPEQYKFMQDWTAEGEREEAEIANKDSIEDMYAKIRAEIDAEGAEQAKWERDNIAVGVPSNPYAIEDNIDHLLVGTPSNPVDFDELRKIAEAKHATKLEPLERNFSEFADSIPETDADKIVREVTDRRLKEDQWDKDYKEGLTRWAAENSEVDGSSLPGPTEVVTNNDFVAPKFKKSVGNVNSIGKSFSGGSLQNDYISPSVSLPGMSEVINSGTIEAPTEKTPTTEGKEESIFPDITTEDALSTLIGLIPHPAAQAFGNMNTIKSLDNLYNKYFK